MRAAVLTSFNQPLEILSVDDPKCPPDGVIVGIEACGVCRSDWHGWIGHHHAVKPPHVPGHEFAGIIQEVGPNCTNFKKGDRVTAPFILACGTCPDCQNDRATTCDNQIVIGFGSPGAFAQYLAVPRADFNLVALPEYLSFVDAAGMGCRVTTAFRALVERAQLLPDEWLAVHGCGGVGLSSIMIAHALGAKIIAIDLNQKALDFATHLGAIHAINARTTDDVGKQIRELTNGGANVSIDALGITETFLNSIYGLAKLGRHIQIGLPLEDHAKPQLPLLELVYLRQISITGTRGMAAAGFPALFDMISSGQINPSKLVSETINLSQASSRLKAMNHNENVGISVINQI